MRFLNERGFSIVQGMVLASIVAGASLVGTKLLTDQKLAQKGAETRDLVEDLHNNIYSTLQHRLNCQRTMTPLLPPVTPNIANSAYDATTFPLSSIVTSDGVTHVQTGAVYQQNSVLLKSMSLGPQQLTSDGKWVRVLSIAYERLNSSTTTRTKQGYGAKEFTKTIALRIQKNPTNATFSACYAVTSSQTNQFNLQSSGETGNDLAKQMCNDIVTSAGQKAFVWDETNSVCVPNIGCGSGTVFTGIDSLGTVKCRSIESWMNLNDVIAPSVGTCVPGATVKLESVLGPDGVTTQVRVNCY